MACACLSMVRRGFCPSLPCEGKHPAMDGVDMIYGQKKRDPVRYFGGMALVVALHIVLIYALINGLAAKVVKAVARPMQTQIIHEVAPPPPPPPKLPPPPPPRVAVPPPPFVPIPVVAPPPTPAPAITAVQTAKPVRSAPVAAPARPASKPAPAPKPKPVNHNVAAVCPNVMTLARSIVYPRLAMRHGIYSGNVVVEFTIDPSGHPKDFVIRSSSNHVFNEAAINVARQLQCAGQGVDVRVLLPIGFQANN